MLVENYYWGMHGFWWLAWFILMFWIFATPYDIPGQRRRKDSPYDILRKRFASGEIDSDEYHKKKKELES